MPVLRIQQHPLLLSLPLPHPPRSGAAGGEGQQALRVLTGARHVAPGRPCGHRRQQRRGAQGVGGQDP